MHIIQFIVLFFVLSFVWVAIIKLGMYKSPDNYHLTVAHFLANLLSIVPLYYIEIILLHEQHIGELIFVFAFFLITFFPFTRILAQTILKLFGWPYVVEDHFWTDEHQENLSTIRKAVITFGAFGYLLSMVGLLVLAIGFNSLFWLAVII